MSDVASLQSRPEGDSRWWTFALPRTRPLDGLDRVPASPKPERKTFRDISLPWMLSQRESAFAAMRKDKEKEKEENSDDNNTPNLTVPIPAGSNPVQYTLSHTSTPGWETPWSARLGAQGPRRPHRESYGFEEMEENESNRSHKEHSPWQRRKKKLRAFILINTYVPLVSRLLNFAAAEKFIMFPKAFPFYQHIVYYCSPRNGYTYTTSGDEPSCCRRHWKLTVSSMTNLQYWISYTFTSTGRSSSYLPH